MELSEILNTALRTTAFSVSPLEQYKARVRQAVLDGPEPSVQLKLSPFIGGSTPLQEMRAQNSADVTYGRHPLGQSPPPVSQVDTPAYTRGSYTLTQGPDVTVTVDLGPILWNHTTRGSSPGGLLDVTA